MIDPEYTYLGQITSEGRDRLVGVSQADRLRHMYIIGKTGTGKSTLLLNMLIQDIAAGRGVGLIDPHGDLAEELLNHIPSWRSDDVVYFNPADTEYPIGLNLLEPVPVEDRHLVASGVVGAFRAIWPDSWGPRMEYIFYMAVAALLECQNVSLLGLPRMLIDSQYRAWVVRQVKDPFIRRYWTEEFAGYSDRYAQEATAPILNKVGQVLAAPALRNIFGQIRSGFSPRFMMDTQRIFIAGLSRGRLGEDKANLLGALLVTQFQVAAMARADLPEHERRTFFLYVDEFSSFATESFSSILSEARKYGLGLTLSNQYLGQLRRPMQDAVFGNVGSLVSLRVGYRDGYELAQEFGSRFKPTDFGEIPNHEAAMKLLVEGEQQQPFQARLIPPVETGWNRAQQITRLSRSRYACRRESIDRKLDAWLY